MATAAAISPLAPGSIQRYATPPSSPRASVAGVALPLLASGNPADGPEDSSFKKVALLEKRRQDFATLQRLEIEPTEINMHYLNCSMDALEKEKRTYILMAIVITLVALVVFGAILAAFIYIAPLTLIGAVLLGTIGLSGTSIWGFISDCLLIYEIRALNKIIKYKKQQESAANAEKSA